MGRLRSITMRLIVQLQEVRGEERFPYHNLTYLIPEEWRICNRCKFNIGAIRVRFTHQFVNRNLTF